ncbi:hypothetical protein [Flavobacterium sp. SM2513]|uniref:hypothetical protein n=1 Tax=Flavobacterium sp. SM2513 TaxID=3424766 RepID=UPI003D7FDF78
MKQLLSEKAPIIKRTFATDKLIDQLKNHKEVLHIWCSVVPTRSLTLVVVHLNDAKKIKKLRKLASVQQLLEANEAVFVFLDTEGLTAHEAEGTLFLSVHCIKEKLVYGADDFSFSGYTESKQHEVYRQRHASVTGFINGLITPSQTNFPVGGGYFYGKAVGYHLGVLEQLAIGTAFPSLSLRKRVLQLGLVLPFTKRFFLRDKDRFFLLDRMYADYEEESYFLDSWWDATLLLLSQLQDAVELVLHHLKALQDRKPLPTLALPEYVTNEPELQHLVSVVAQEPRIEELYVFHTREFLVAGPIKRHYFLIVFVAPESKLTGKEVRLLMETQLPERSYQCSFMVVSKIATQHLLFSVQSFFINKIMDSNCIYKKDPYAPDFHWTNKVDQYYDDLELYYDRMQDTYEKMLVFLETNSGSADALTLLPKANMHQLLLLMFQVYVYKKLYYVDEFCHDLELFLGLAVYHSIEITGIWNRFNSTVLDLLPFFDSESDVFVNVEKAGFIQGFYKELHGVIDSSRYNF